MPLLSRVASTDDKINTAISNHESITQLAEVRERFVLAVSLGLQNITASSLPAIMKYGDQLATIRKKDESLLLKALVILIGIINKDLNVPRMTAEQSIKAARQIVKEFWYLKPEEIAYAFERGAGGHYGTSFNRIDWEVINKWLLAYDVNDRMHLVESSRQITDDETETVNKLTADAVRDSYKRISEGEPLLQEKIEANKKEAEKQERKKQNAYNAFKIGYFESRGKSTPSVDPYDASNSNV